MMEQWTVNSDASFYKHSSESNLSLENWLTWKMCSTFHKTVKLYWSFCRLHELLFPVTTLFIQLDLCFKEESYPHILVYRNMSFLFVIFHQIFYLFCRLLIPYMMRPFIWLWSTKGSSRKNMVCSLYTLIQLDSN